MDQGPKAMRTGLLGSVSALLAAAPLALGRPAPPAQLPPALPADLPSAAAPEKPVTPAKPATDAAAAPDACQPPAQPEVWHDDHVGPGEQIWLGGGYLLWRVKGGPEPTPLAAAVTGLGTSGQASTTILGATHLDYGTFNGINLDGGMWFDDRHTVGLELGGFLLE